MEILVFKAIFLLSFSKQIQQSLFSQDCVIFNNFNNTENMDSNKQEFPKIVWILWFQGWDQAPELVLKVRDSWKYHNPNWEIKELDDNRIKEIIPDVCGCTEKDYEEYNKQHKSFDKDKEFVKKYDYELL